MWFLLGGGFIFGGVKGLLGWLTYEQTNTNNTPGIQRVNKANSEHKANNENNENKANNEHKVGKKREKIPPILRFLYALICPKMSPYIGLSPLTCTLKCVKIVKK